MRGASLLSQVFFNSTIFGEILEKVCRKTFLQNTFRRMLLAELLLDQSFLFFTLSIFKSWNMFNLWFSCTLNFRYLRHFSLFFIFIAFKSTNNKNSLKTVNKQNVGISVRLKILLPSSQHFNTGSTLKTKQNPTSDFQRCTTLIQRQCPTLKQLRNNVTQRRNNVAQRWYNVDTTLFQPSVDVS